MQEFFTDNHEKKQAFVALLSNPKRIVITTHQNPDGDAIGSSLGLWAILNQLGHSVKVIPPTDSPDFLKWMPNFSEVIHFESSSQSEAKSLIANAEIIFCLDFSSYSRLKTMEANIKASTAPIVLIDHHEQPEVVAEFVFWNQKAAATCELVYQLVEQTFGTATINKDAATCLYAGLVTDTGSFRFDSTTCDVHRIAGELINKGIRPSLIHRQLFDTNTFDRMRFLGYALHEKLTYLPDYRVAYFTFSKEELELFNSKNGDTEGIVNYGLSIKGTVMSAIFVEREDLIKISFRSVEDFSVSELARTHFDGGGHKNAAGGRSYDSLEKTLEKFLTLLPTYKETLLEQPM